MNRIISLLLIAISPSLIHAQTEYDHNLGLHVEHDGGSNYNASWWGAEGWTAFPQFSTDLENWSYAGELAFAEDEVIEFGINADLQNSGDKFFFRLILSDMPIVSINDDFDSDGYTNRDELALGTDPLDATDTNLNGIPDDVAAYWNAIPGSWKQAFVDDTNKAFYDPDGLINSLALVMPNDDYDGDSVSNIMEHLNGTDPIDFFNGSTNVYLKIIQAEGENVAPQTYLNPPLIVKVVRRDGSTWNNAPILLSTVSNHAGLAADQIATPQSSLLVRAGYDGALVEFYAPSAQGAQEILVEEPKGGSMTATVYVVSPASVAKLPIRDFQTIHHGDGSRTYSFTSDDDSGDWFHIFEKRADGTHDIIFETTFGSPELPYVSGQNQYTLTLDGNNQPVIP